MTNSKSKISVSVVLSVYNEEVLLEAALDKCLKIFNNDFDDYELIIVNDGSKDKTKSILETKYCNHPNIVHLDNYINLNQGVSIQRGMAVSSKEFVVYNGIDLPLDPEDIRYYIDKMNEIDILVLERQKYNGATQWRLLTSKVNQAIRKILFPILSKGFQDLNFTQIYRKSILHQIMPLAKSPAFTAPEMILRAKVLGLNIKTVTAKYDSRLHGRGALGKVHDILWTIYDMFRFRYLLWIGLKKHAKT